MIETIRRRLDQAPDEGATLVFAAVILVGMLAMAAFAIDFGSIWEERRQLQNGADAAALAIAEDCARGACPADEYATAEIYVDGNARDGAAWAYQVDLDLSAKEVTVYNATENAGGDHLHNLLFASAVGFNDFTIGADATVVWGYPLQIETFPIIISECEWNKTDPGWPGGGANLQYDEADMLPPEAPIEIQFHDGNATEDCAAQAGQDENADGRLPGGFGWLQSVNCQAEVYGADPDPDNIDYGWAPGDTGSSPSSGCSDNNGSTIESLLMGYDQYGGLISKTIFIPYFDDLWTGPANGTGPCGSNAKCYHIAGYGAFHVTGYRFSGGPKYTRYVNPPHSGAPCSGPGQNDIRCLAGYFVNAVYGGDGDLGGEDRGVVVIRFAG